MRRLGIALETGALFAMDVTGAATANLAGFGAGAWTCPYVRPGAVFDRGALSRG